MAELVDVTEWAEQFADTMLAPLQNVGVLLAKEIDALKTRVSELEAHVDRLADAENF